MTKIRENVLLIQTDGSLHRGRKGGYGIHFVHIDEIGEETVIEDFSPPGIHGTTGNRMELLAVVEALKMATKMDCYSLVDQIVIQSDSQYVVENYTRSLGFWRTNRWKNSDGKPVDNADLWKDFNREYGKVRKPKDIEWIPRKQNKVADKLANQSAKHPLSKKSFRSSVRRKTSTQQTEVGSVPMNGQTMVVRILEPLWMKEQKTWKYRYEVLSEGEHQGKLDFIYSTEPEPLRDGHHYEIEVNTNTRNPTIERVIVEILPTPEEQG